jgi:hypothetical protein
MARRISSEPSQNLAARLARRIIAGGQARRRPVRTLLFILLLLAWLGLTGYGAYEASTAGPVWRRVVDALYGPFTFLAPQDGYLDGHGLNDSLLFGRFFGAALPVIAVFWVWLHWSRMAMARMLARWARGHIIIVARAGAADRIAMCSSRGGQFVILVEPGVSDVRSRELAAAGVLVVPDGTGLAESFVQARANHAAQVLAWSGQDAQSIADGVSAGRLLGKSAREIAVHVESAETQRALRHAPDLLISEKAQLRPISITIAAIRLALRGEDLVAAAMVRKQDRGHVGFHGSSTALQAAATMVLRHNWSIHLAAPRVTCVQPSDEGWDAWSSHHRTLFQHARDVLGCEPDDLFRRKSRQMLVADQTITRHIVDLEDDDATLRAAFNLASELAQLHETPPLVQAVLRDSSAAQALIDQSKLWFAPAILLSDDRSVSGLIARAEDREAALIHKEYLANVGGGEVSASAPWEDLAETFVHANRAAADHNAVKSRDIATARAEGWDEVKLRETLARTEHDRWSMERLLDGWAPGLRSNDRLLHNNLTVWGKLPPETQQKDFMQIDKLLAEAAEPIAAPAKAARDRP